MRSEMTELRRDVNDVKSKGADKVQWPTINSKGASINHGRNMDDPWTTVF